jgi:hypothetical protein
MNDEMTTGDVARAYGYSRWQARRILAQLHADFGSAVVVRRGHRYYTTKRALERATARSAREAGSREEGAVLAEIRRDLMGIHEFKGKTEEGLGDLEVRIRNLESLFLGQEGTGGGAKYT